jgi:hypothetical protein
MNGIQYVTDEKGRKVGVLIDLKKHGAVWQDFWDGLVSESRRKELEALPDNVLPRVVRKNRISRTQSPPRRMQKAEGLLRGEVVFGWLLLTFQFRSKIIPPYLMRSDKTGCLAIGKQRGCCVAEAKNTDCAQR